MNNIEILIVHIVIVLLIIILSLGLYVAIRKLFNKSYKPSNFIVHISYEICSILTTLVIALIIIIVVIIGSYLFITWFNSLNIFNYWK